MFTNVELFYACERCGKVYWEGSHHTAVKTRFSDLLMGHRDKIGERKIVVYWEGDSWKPDKCQQLITSNSMLWRSIPPPKVCPQSNDKTIILSLPTSTSHRKKLGHQENKYSNWETLVVYRNSLNELRTPGFPLSKFCMGKRHIWRFQQNH